MKKIARSALLLFLFCSGSSCRTDGCDPAPPQEEAPRFSVEEARTAFETYLPATRSAGHDGVLAPGETEVYWHTAAYSCCDYGSSYDVELFVGRCYQTVWETPDGRRFGDLIRPRLVVARAHEEYQRETTPYLAYYIPDPDEERCPTDDVSAGLLNSLPKTGFSGRIIYTDLLGFPAAVSQHADGEQIDRVFLYETMDSLAILQAIEHYNRLVADIRIRRIAESGDDRTRANTQSNDNTTDGGTIDDVVVIAPPLPPKLPIIIPDYWKYRRPTSPVGSDDLHKPKTPGAGGSGPNRDSEDGKYSKNPNIKVDDEVVQDMLDEIYEDCMGRTLLNAIDCDVTIVVNDIPQGFQGKNGTFPHYDDNGQFNSSTIYFADGGESGRKRAYVLLEEMIHTYQYMNLAREDFQNQKLNNEIEAKIGWLLYQQRKLDGMGYTQFNYDNQLGRGGTRIFQDLSWYIQFPNDPSFTPLYENRSIPKH